MNESHSAQATGSFSKTFRSDFLASIVVFLVALPLCMGIALASGAPPAAGIITGIVAGLLVGFLAGSPLQVSGPAAGLSVIVWELITRCKEEYLNRQGDLAAMTESVRQAAEAGALNYALMTLGIVIFIAGVTQLVAGLLGWGQWFRAVSPAVIQGMLAGIGVLILASQFHVMIDDQPRASGIANLLSIPEAVWKGLVPQDDGNVNHYWAARIGVLTILIIVLWKGFAPKRLKAIPAPLVAVVVGASAAAALGLGINYVSMPDNLLQAIRVPTLDVVTSTFDSTLILAGLSMALIASAETLLCATAVDQLHQGPRTRYNRELAAQGVGNMVCGLIGGLPMTGVIVRSAANVEAGGRTRLPAILHGAWLLVFVCLAPFVLKLIPIASLAAILVYTGYKLMNFKLVKELWKLSHGEAIIFVITVATIVFTDLLTGVLVGVGLSAVKLLYTFSRLSVHLDHRPLQGRTVLHLRGAATFLRLPKLAAILENVPPDAELHVQCDHLAYIDHACMDLLMNWEKQHRGTGGRLILDWDDLAARFKQLNGAARKTIKAEKPTEVKVAG